MRSSAAKTMILA